MSFTASYMVGKNSRVLQKGSQPKKETTWQAKVWLTLPSGECHTHSATVPNNTFAGMVPVVTQLLDGLLEDNGNVILSAGWKLSTH